MFLKSLNTIQNKSAEDIPALFYYHTINSPKEA